MKKILLKLSPYLFVFFGLLVLFMTRFAYVAGAFLLLGIVMIVERVWPEKWDSEMNKQNQ